MSGRQIFSFVPPGDPTAAPYPWKDTLLGLGVGLLGGKNFGEGAAQGLLYANQFAGQRRAERRQDEGDKRQQQQFEWQRQQIERQQQEADARKASIQAMFGGGQQPPPQSPAGVPGMFTGGLQAGPGQGPQAAQMPPQAPQPPQQGGAPDLSQYFRPEELQMLQGIAQFDPDQAEQIVQSRIFAKPTEGPANVQEYEYAKKQGFQGSLLDFEKAKAEAGRTPAQPPATSLLTLVSPDGKTVSVDSRDPKVAQLLQQGYVQRESSMFPAPPSGYALTPQGLTAIPGGPADPKTKPPTEDQAKGRQLYERLVPQLAIVDKTFTALTDPKAQAMGILPGSNYFQSEDYQRAEGALKDIAASYLYSVSGATANPGEVANLVQTITPRFGDKPEALADKQSRIKQMVDSVKTRAAIPGDAGPPTAQPEAAPDYGKMTDQELLDYIKQNGGQ